MSFLKHRQFNSTDDRCKRIAAQRVLKDTRQLRISVIDVLYILRQALDNVTKEQKTTIDVSSLLQAGASGTSLIGSFRARQIH